MISKLIPLSILLLIASCASTVVTDSEPELVDVRQGEQVKQICFASSINGWREVEGQRHSVILTKGVRDEYKLDLSGVCDVSNAMMNIATRTRGSSCLTRGDEIIVTVNRNEKEIEYPVTLKNKNGNTKLYKREYTKLNAVLGGEFRPASDLEKQKLRISSGLKVKTITSGKLRNAGIEEGFIITKIFNQN